MILFNLYIAPAARCCEQQVMYNKFRYIVILLSLDALRLSTGHAIVWQTNWGTTTNPINPPAPKLDLLATNRCGRMPLVAIYPDHLST